MREICTDNGFGLKIKTKTEEAKLLPLTFTFLHKTHIMFFQIFLY